MPASEPSQVWFTKIVMDFKKQLRIGTVKTWEGGRWCSVFVTVKYKDGRLSFTGVEGPLSTGNCIGSCGQIEMHLKVSQIKSAKGWTKGMISQVLKTWRKWHLNDMRPGVPVQMQALEGFEGDYTARCARLEELGLLVVDGYKYGSKWIREEVPEDVLAIIKSWPDADRPNPWGSC